MLPSPFPDLAPIAFGSVHLGALEPCHSQSPTLTHTSTLFLPLLIELHGWQYHSRICLDHRPGIYPAKALQRPSQPTDHPILKTILIPVPRSQSIARPWGGLGLYVLHKYDWSRRSPFQGKVLSQGQSNFCHFFLPVKMIPWPTYLPSEVSLLLFLFCASKKEFFYRAAPLL